MNNVPNWRLAGDWFDLQLQHSLSMYAQAPTNNACAGMLAWHIRQGNYGDDRLDGLNLLGLGAFEGNVWTDEAKVRMGLFIDERTDEVQRQALQTIFGGHAGGWPGIFARKIGELRGVEFVPITFEVADDLACWRAEIPGRLSRTGSRTIPGPQPQPESVSKPSIPLAPK